VGPAGEETFRSWRGRRVAAWILLSLVVACGGDASRSPSVDPTPVPQTATPSRSPDPTAAAPPLSAVRIRLIPVATLEQPLAMAVRPGDPSLYVAQKTGAVMRIQDGRVDPTPVLDLAGSISLGSEQGLLGLAFSPEGRDLYVNYTDTSGDTHVTAYRWRDDRADPASRRDVLVVDQPYANHNGGNLAFGPDRYLYVGLGDGGSGGDPHDHGQSLSTVLGKMLRIDPRPSNGRSYTIPPGNPFVGREGARPEIWALGLRNPWRYSFDRATGDLWIADVGQSAWEEIDRQPAGSDGGENYGWNRMEGDHPFEGDPPPGVVRPVFEYSHDSGGCTVTGGYVYRGHRIPGLVGAYVFGDFCLGRLEAIRLEDGGVRHRVLGPTVAGLSSFGQDAQGELYAMSLGGALYRIAPAA
jgi:glucose/arabinose dehydrogenase